MGIDRKVELVAGAGDWASLRAGVDAGADGIYFGLKKFNLRANAFNFQLSQLEKITAFLHKNKKKAYLVLNTILFNSEIREAKKYLLRAKQAKVDAVIVWDMAFLELAKEVGLSSHLSTQASVANYPALKKYVQEGVKRVVLARECSLTQIKAIWEKIKKEKLDCSLEVFAHGAMCVSFSGRCFLSQFSFGESANCGRCLQVCRRNFKIIELQDNKEYLLGKREILSAKDLATLSFLNQIISSGVGALKIEGRRRPPEYIYLVVSVYRRAIDLFYQGKLSLSEKSKLKKTLKQTYNRGFSSGFYLGQPRQWQSRGLEATYQKIYLGQVRKFYQKINVAEIKIANKISLAKGESLLFTGKTTGVKFARAGEIQINHNPVELVLPGQSCAVKLNIRARPNDKVFIWRKKI